MNSLSHTQLMLDFSVSSGTAETEPYAAQISCLAAQISCPEHRTPPKASSGVSGAAFGSGVGPALASASATPEHPVVPVLRWVESYPVKRGKYRYYRFCYLILPADIRSVVRHHIGGGDIKSALALRRKAEVESAIRAGWPPALIEQLIRSWRRQT